MYRKRIKVYECHKVGLIDFPEICFGMGILEVAHEETRFLPWLNVGELRGGAGTGDPGAPLDAHLASVSGNLQVT